MSRSTNSNNVRSNGSTCSGDSIKMLKFVSENDCRTEGRFSERMKRLGVKSNVGIGISHMKTKPLNCIPAVQVTSQKHLDRINYIEETKRKTNPKQSYNWQPLSLAALAEYTRHMDAPGVGVFKGGGATFWKPAVILNELYK